MPFAGDADGLVADADGVVGDGVVGAASGAAAAVGDVGDANDGEPVGLTGWVDVRSAVAGAFGPTDAVAGVGDGPNVTGPRVASPVM